MTDDLSRLLDLPAAARLSAAGDELSLLTLRHEHADKIIIERQRLGGSIDLAELLQFISGHGLMPAPQLQVTEVVAPQLPAPVAEVSAPKPRARRSTRNPSEELPCFTCNRTFKNLHALQVHQGRGHKEPALSPESEPAETEPDPVPPVSEHLCSTCGTSLKLHERCGDCQALLGPEHEAGMTHIQVNGKPLCRTCTSYRGTARKLGIEA